MESAARRALRYCQVCGLAVGSYEPAVFIFGDETIHSSRAARPGLSALPDCRLEHEGCHPDDDDDDARSHLQLV
jgi:hypothetical protein